MWQSPTAPGFAPCVKCADSAGNKWHLIKEKLRAGCYQLRFWTIQGQNESLQEPARFSFHQNWKLCFSKFAVGSVRERRAALGFGFGLILPLSISQPRGAKAGFGMDAREPGEFCSSSGPRAHRWAVRDKQGRLAHHSRWALLIPAWFDKKIQKNLALFVCL